MPTTFQVVKTGVTGFQRKRVRKHPPKHCADFKDITAALNELPAILVRWLPNGRVSGPELTVRNPLRADRHAGSYSINLRTGRRADFATGDRGSRLLPVRPDRIASFGRRPGLGRGPPVGPALPDAGSGRPDGRAVMNALLPPPIEHVSSLRDRLWDAGWRPVALHTYEKRPYGDAWPERARRDPPEAAASKPDLQGPQHGSAGRRPPHPRPRHR